jgi:transposase InsO family protein
MADRHAGQVRLHFIPPGEPWRNGYVESFNSRIRDECRAQDGRSMIATALIDSPRELGGAILWTPSSSASLVIVTPRPAPRFR